MPKGKDIYLESAKFFASLMSGLFIAGALSVNIISVYLGINNFSEITFLGSNSLSFIGDYSRITAVFFILGFFSLGLALYNYIKYTIPDQELFKLTTSVLIIGLVISLIVLFI